MNINFLTIDNSRQCLQWLLYQLFCKFVAWELVKKHSERYCLLLWRVAEIGSVDAQFELAMMFRYTNSRFRDNDLFQCWAYAAYEQGHIGAIFELAKYYRMMGEGSRRLSDTVYIKHIDLAYELFEAAAVAGVLEAQEMLADMHRIGEGIGVPEWDGAIYWYNEAASNGSESAQEMRDYMITSLGLSEWFPDSFKVDWFSENKQIG